MSGLRLCVVLLCLSCVYTARIKTNTGELEGSSYITSTGREIFRFLGIPYARPPVGKHRFEEPKSAKNWTGIWPAFQQSSTCIQFNTIPGVSEQIIGNEDCLYLNIYTPTLSNTSNLPVLVYFHGGAFMFEKNNINSPNFFLQNYQIVHVTVNYRLGPFGFLSTHDNVVPGNNGLKDQVLALKWVQDNIAAFGGDKTRVTIAGNSAAGASVHFHYLSPLSQGLFDKGISSSGSVLVPWALIEEPLQKAKVLAESVGCPINATDFMIRCLKQRPSRQILSKSEPSNTPWLFNSISQFGPVVENSTRIPFLSEQPYQLLLRGETYDGPWLTSVTTEEGLYPAAPLIDQPELLQTLNDNWYTVAPHLLNFNDTILYKSMNTVNEEVKTFYFGTENITETNQDKLIEMVGDRLFKADMGLAARLQASVSTSPVFFYTFGYRGKISFSDLFTTTKANFGVSHFDDMYYILGLPESSQLDTETDKAMISVMTNVWASFIETGQPIPAEGAQWDPIPTDSAETGMLTHLMIKSSDDMVMTKTDNFGNHQFWDTLGFNENLDYGDILLEPNDEL